MGLRWFVSCSACRLGLHLLCWSTGASSSHRWEKRRWRGAVCKWIRLVGRITTLTQPSWSTASLPILGRCGLPAESLLVMDTCPVTGPGRDGRMLGKEDQPRFGPPEGLLLFSPSAEARPKKCCWQCPNKCHGDALFLPLFYIWFWCYGTGWLPALILFESEWIWIIPFNVLCVVVVVLRPPDHQTQGNFWFWSFKGVSSSGTWLALGDVPRLSGLVLFHSAKYRIFVVLAFPGASTRGELAD